MDKKELICSDCGQYESECKCQATPPTDEGLREKIAQWLFTMKYRMPEQRFYHSWHDETSASPLTEKEYLNLANELLALVQQVIERDYVRLDKDQMLPRNDRDVHIWMDYTPDMAYEAGQHDMTKAGWRKIR